LPALRIAAGFLHTPAALAPAPTTTDRVDIVHTELCSLHLDPSDHSVEQFVVQSLFADGFIRYAMRPDVESDGLRLLAIDERILPDSGQSMSWSMSDVGMHMSLAGDVPAKIAAPLRGFVSALYEKAGMSFEEDAPRSVFAIHPGGPKIIDRVCEVLALDDAQVQTSRDVLFDHGNMSSATLPHIWMRLVQDQSVAPGTIILGLAFGPGLTVCGGLFRKL
jgi:predicted naringenin-chalcone synthase